MPTYTIGILAERALKQSRFRKAIKPEKFVPVVISTRLSFNEAITEMKRLFQYYPVCRVFCETEPSADGHIYDYYTPWRKLLANDFK